MKVVIVGGVAGGASAAARIRRLDEQAEIVVFERSGYMSYANCGLPYYIGGVITDPEELTLQTPQSFYNRFRVAVKVRHEVTAIHPERKTVSVTDLESGNSFEESYDKLILSPGAKPARPPLPGLDGDRIFTLRTVEDTFAIYDFVQAEQPKRAVVVGGGFIGLETAENLVERGVHVTLVERLDQVMPPLDRDMAAQLHILLREKGIDLRLSCSVTGFVRENGSIVTTVEGADPIPADMVILAVGVSPDTALAKSAGLELGQRGSIAVNDRMETSVPHIYAVGDAVEVRHFVTGQKAVVALAGPANKQGRIAADNICGGDSRFAGAQGSSVLKLFELTAACTGINEATARAAGIDYDKVVLSPGAHAGYYPGGTPLTVKVLWEKDSLRLLGAQIVGMKGADKRIDVLATAIRAGMKATELVELDLAYAPPYSSAKDPVNMAGFMIENIVTGKVKQIHWHDVAGLPRDGSAVLIDVRTPREYDNGHVDGFVNLPVDELRDRMDEIPCGKPVYLFCQSALRSYIGCRILSQHGYDCYNISGGYRFYSMVAADRKAAMEAYPCGMEK